MPELPEVYGYTYVANREIHGDYLIGVEFKSGKYATGGKRTIEHHNDFIQSFPLRVTEM